MRHMPEGALRIRFHLDENVDPAIAGALRRAGIDVTTSQEARLLRQPDESRLDFARRAGRVIVTHDEDFLVIASLTADHPGIVYRHIRARTMREIVDRLILIQSVLRLTRYEGKSNPCSTDATV
jgi:predicted nuclease of predicted toxin-antitoxin system